MRKGTRILSDKDVRRIEKQFERKRQLQRMRRKLEDSVEEQQRSIAEKRKKLALVIIEGRGITPASIAPKYNVSAQTIYRIQKNWMRRNWRG